MLLWVRHTKLGVYPVVEAPRFDIAHRVKRFRLVDVNAVYRIPTTNTRSAQYNATKVLRLKIRN